MGEDDGGQGGVEGVPGGLHRGVREVHDDAELVHLLDHRLVKIRVRAEKNQLVLNLAARNSSDIPDKIV